MILTIAGEDLATMLDAATRIASKLREHPEVAWLRDGLDLDQLDALYVLLPAPVWFPVRRSGPRARGAATGRLTLGARAA